MSSTTLAVAEQFDSTTRARQESLISPRFYTTDYAALDRIGILVGSAFAAALALRVAEEKERDDREHGENNRY